MDSTHNGRHSEEKIPAQRGLFDSVERVQRTDEVKPVLSAHPNLPLRTEQHGEFRPTNDGKSSGHPVLVTNPAETQEPVWLRRTKLVIYVLFCIELGLFLAVAPWWPTLWNENSLLAGYPTLQAILQLYFVRGAVTGLGLVDVWLGIREAVNYRENDRQ